jgi:hypothetical protein
MAHSTLPLQDFPSQQPESPKSTRFTDYLMLDLAGTVLEVRRMSPSEARDTNLELEALDVPFHWVTLASMGD